MIIFAWVQREIHDMPQAFTVIMLLLTFPIGHPAAMAEGFINWSIHTMLNVPYVPFWDEAPMWVAMTLTGDIQWFVFMPFLWSKIRGRPMKHRLAVRQE